MGCSLSNIDAKVQPDIKLNLVNKIDHRIVKEVIKPPKIESQFYLKENSSKLHVGNEFNKIMPPSENNIKINSFEVKEEHLMKKKIKNDHNENHGKDSKVETFLNTNLLSQTNKVIKKENFSSEINLKTEKIPKLDQKIIPREQLSKFSIKSEFSESKDLQSIGKISQKVLTPQKCIYFIKKSFFEFKGKKHEEF